MGDDHLPAEVAEPPERVGVDQHPVGGGVPGRAGGGRGDRRHARPARRVDLQQPGELLGGGGHFEQQTARPAGAPDLAHGGCGPVGHRDQGGRVGPVGQAEHQAVRARRGPGGAEVPERRGPARALLPVDPPAAAGPDQVDPARVHHRVVVVPGDPDRQVGGGREALRPGVRAEHQVAVAGLDRRRSGPGGQRPGPRVQQRGHLGPPVRRPPVRRPPGRRGGRRGGRRQRQLGQPAGREQQRTAPGQRPAGAVCRVGGVGVGRCRAQSRTTPVTGIALTLS